MIETLFFPFSHINKDQLKIVSSFFHNLGFLPLVSDFASDPRLAGMAEQGILQPVFSLAEELEPIEKQVGSYLDWAKIHQGNEKNLKSLLKAQPYFMDDTALPCIQSQIRSGTIASVEQKRNEQKKVEQKKTIPNPLLLLKFAQLLDAQNEAIDDELDALEQSKTLLFSELIGEKDTVEKPGTGSYMPGAADPGSIMTKEKIMSWFGYACGKELFDSPGEPPLLITTSQAVLDYMVSRSETVINALDIDSIKVHENECVNKGKWQQDLFEFLKDTVIGKQSSGSVVPEADDTCLLSGQLKLYIFPENDSKAFLNTPGQSIAVCLVTLKS